MITQPTSTNSVKIAHKAVKSPDGVSGFSVQLTMPVDNPENNVLMRRRKGMVTFEVPVNYPSIHTATYSQLLLAANRCQVVRTVHKA